jgi:hypothetical protein
MLNEALRDLAGLTSGVVVTIFALPNQPIGSQIAGYQPSHDLKYAES